MCDGVEQHVVATMFADPNVDVRKVGFSIADEPIYAAHGNDNEPVMCRMRQIRLDRVFDPKETALVWPQLLPVLLRAQTEESTASSTTLVMSVRRR